MTNEDHDDRMELALARVGSVLKDKWRLDRLIGSGGMASVYAATHRNGKRVAVKVLHPRASLDPGVRRRFQREGYVANRVGHPGAVEVLDDDVTDDGTAFLVMQLLEGESLQSRIDRVGKLSPAEVVSIVDPLLDVLITAHAKGIVHRDLKPDNVFLTTDGSVKVLDFGIAWLGELTGHSHATSVGTPMGTPAFMPPEQARGRWAEVDPRSDLWAVGATMFVALSGRNVHEAHTVNELLLAAMTSAAPPLASVAPHVPARLCAVVDGALAFDRAARWPGARAMQRELRQVRDDLALATDGAVESAPDSITRALELAPLLQATEPLAPVAVDDAPVPQRLPVEVGNATLRSELGFAPAAPPAPPPGGQTLTTHAATVDPVSRTLSGKLRRNKHVAWMGAGLALLLLAAGAIAVTADQPAEESAAPPPAPAAPMPPADPLPSEEPPAAPPVASSSTPMVGSAAASAPRRAPPPQRPAKKPSVFDQPFLDKREH